MRARLALRTLHLAVWFACLFPPVSLVADEVPVRYREGRVHGFLVLRDLNDQIIASGTSMQSASGNRVTNLIWVNGFDLKPNEYTELTRALAEGLREGDGGAHPITFHPGGGNSSSYFHKDSWLAYNTIQTWSDYWRIHPLVIADYCRLPVKPVVLAEGAYEAGPEYPTRPITPLIIRKQAWWSFLAGGFHTYGHNDMWRKNPAWRAALDSPGALQMGVLKRLLASHEWWKLMPDQSVLDVAGSGRDLDAAAVSTSGDFAVNYLSSRHSVKVDLGKVSASAQVRATWINPETGELSGQAVSASAGLHSFTPALQSEDAVLLLEAVR